MVKNICSAMPSEATATAYCSSCTAWDSTWQNNFLLGLELFTAKLASGLGRETIGRCRGQFTLPVFSRQYLARYTADPGLHSARVIFDQGLGNLSNTFAKYYSTNPTYYIPCFYHTFFPFWQHPIFSSLSYNRSWCIFSVCFLLCPLIFQHPNSQRTKPTSQFGVTQVRFQPIVSCQGTYQAAVSVPCLGAPFSRGIWAVGIKNCAVTVPTLRPLGLLEMRKSRLCVCPSLGPHGLLELLTLQGLLPKQHPDVCRGSSSAGSNIPWPSSALQFQGLALPARPFPT